MNELKGLNLDDGNTAWADLECLMAHENFEPYDFERVVKIGLSFDLSFEDDPFGAFDSTDESLNIPQNATLSEFIQLVTEVKCNTITATLPL
jgi:hypothetical protein